MLQNCGAGWTKEFREMGGKRLRQTILTEMTLWGMAEVEEDTGLVRLLPALFRLSGSYPADYVMGGSKRDGK